MQLKLRLYRKDCTLFGWVEYQDEKLRAEEDDSKILARNSKFTISSCFAPVLESNALFVKGHCRLKDNDMFSYTFGSISEAVSVANHIKPLVEEINSTDNSLDNDIEKIL